MAGQLDLSQFGGSSGSADNASTSDSSTQLDLSKFGGAGSSKDTSSPQLDLSAFMGSNSNPTTPAPSTGWNGPFNNPIGRFTGVNALADLVGGKVNEFENWSGINKINGAIRGISNPNHFDTNIAPSDGSYLGNLSNWGQNALAAVKNISQSATEGFNNPDATSQRFNDTLNKNLQNFDPVSRAALGFAANAGTDALSFIPVGDVLKGAGTMLKDTSDFAGATPYIAKGLDAVANAPLIKPAIQGTQDVLGNMFTKNYGATPSLVDMIGETRGSQALNENNILGSLKELNQGHGLTPDELNQTGHVVEKTMQGTPEQQAFAQKWSSLADNGPQMPQGSSPIGTQSMLNTASAVHGEPLLQGQIDNHFAHQYDNVPKELQGVFPKRDFSNGSGLSPDGTFNKPRTYDTLQEAQANGLKPVLDPFQVLGNQLKQSSDALTNNSLLQKIKNEPGMLFEKDPLDEIAKLTKTGRMDSQQAIQAMQALGLTEKDLVPGGIVQSKIPQLSGSYIRKADEAALQEHLNPARPAGPFALANKAQNVYNKGFLLNPLPHMHNILTNGVALGGANLKDIRGTFDNLKNGVPDAMHQQALEAGALSNPVGGRFSDAISHAVANTDGNLLSRSATAPVNAIKNILTDTGTLKGNLKSAVAPLSNASHDLLWNTDAAIRTSLFRNAINAGATDAEAAARTNKFMVDYNNITPFERKYIKPLIPFYAWKKGNLPMQAGQTIAQTPKYMAMNNINNAVSQAVSGQPTDAKGRINSGQMLPDGSTTMVDPYISMHDAAKVGEKGIVPFAYNSLSPAIKELLTQGTSLSQAFGLPIQNKFPIYNPAAPLGFNIRAGLAHGINALNPLSGSAIAGEVGSQSNAINKLFGMPTNNKPDQTTLEAVTKLLGGFTGRSNPATDAKTQYYQNKQNQLDLKRFMKVEAKVNANK